MTQTGLILPQWLFCLRTAPELGTVSCYLNSKSLYQATKFRQHGQTTKYFLQNMIHFHYCQWMKCFFFTVISEAPPQETALVMPFWQEILNKLNSWWRLIDGWMLWYYSLKIFDTNRWNQTKTDFDANIRINWFFISTYTNQALH